ncbi:MAG: serine/threonine protein kinase, partial [Gemmataceae bacterium]
MEKVDEFVQVLTDQRLLQPDQLAELTPTYLKRFSDARALSKYLIQRGWLSIYQANQIFQGNTSYLVVGPYRILDLLGEGAVSMVFKAFDTRRKCVAALKTIKEEHLNNMEALGRFKREMRVIASLNHPNIVHAFDVDMDNPRHYFAMEYVEGTDLGKLVKFGGPIMLYTACDYIRQAALGLQHGHEHGLVHRDIKPGNLLLTKANIIKLLDMGMARLRPAAPGQESLNRLTMEGMMIGTPDYLAPEQARNPHGADIRADIYSLGCTFYYLLTGEPPFPGRTVWEKLLNHQQQRPNLD